jgi:WhiB family redox-sensing transcriptional regulator
VSFAVALPAWRRHAACRGQAVLFFASDPMSHAIAVSICAGCGVREACLAEVLAEEAGLSSDERFGVRGGLRPSQRG